MTKGNQLILNYKFSINKSHDYLILIIYKFQIGTESDARNVTKFTQTPI